MFNGGKVNHLYPEMNPGERITRLLHEFLNPVLEPKGFVFIKSQRSFKKKNDFFEYHISWFTSKFNRGNLIVKFRLWLSVYSPRYRKWEKDFYNLETKSESSIDGHEVEYIKNWNQDYSHLGSYDLVKHDNEAVMNKIIENLELVGLPYFENFDSLDSAIEELKKYPIANFEKIVDFFITQNKYEEAIDFFENNNGWHEEQKRTEGQYPESPFSLNRSKPYESRREKLKNWAQQNL